MARWRSLALGVAVSAICLYLAMAQVDLSRVWTAFSEADARWLAGSLIPIFGSFVVRCWKWQVFLLPENRTRFAPVFSSTMIGYLGNALLPGRVGELARAALLRQSEGVPVARGLGTIFIEKIVDVLFLVLLLGVLIMLIPVPPWASTAGLVAAVAFGAAGVVFFILAAARERLLPLVQRWVDPLPVVGRLGPSRLVEAVLGSAESLRHPPLLLTQLALTVVMWGLALITVLCTANAFHLQIPWTAAALVLVATNLGMTVPAAPASLGVYHGIAVAVLVWFGVDKDLALSFAFALHALGFGSMIATGAVLLLTGAARGQLRMADLWRWQPDAIGTVSQTRATAAG